MGRPFMRATLQDLPWATDGSLERDLDPKGRSLAEDVTRWGVVTPTLNGERFFERTLESIWSQQSDRVLIDHVIVDGGSTDRTLEIAARYPSRVLRPEDDRGMYDAVNKGLAVVGGDVVGYINADDEIAPGAMEVVSEAFRTNPDAGWVCGKVEYVGPDDEVLGAMQPVRPSLRAYLGIGWSPIPQQTVWSRRSFFDRIGPFDVEFKNCGDYDWYARALKLQHPMILRQVLGRFRLHSGQISLDPTKMERESRMVLERHGAPGFATWALGRTLSLRLNALNPSWFVAKKRGRIKFTLD
jgi:glycosyltransferase involved in cell wall biosynthesis